MSVSQPSKDKANAGGADGAMDINEVFRSGGRAVEFLDWINMASIVRRR